MANWYQKQKINIIANSLQTVATDIAKLADDINVSKSQYLREKSNAKMWTDPNSIQKINNSLNQCWQSVVSAARALRLANNIYEAGNSIAKARSFVGTLCQVVDCSHQSLSSINNALTTASQKIEALAS